MTRVQARKGSSFKKTSTNKAGLLKEIEALNIAAVEVKRLLDICSAADYDSETSAEKENIKSVLTKSAQLCGKEALVTPRVTGRDGVPVKGKYRRSQRGRSRNRRGR